MGKTRKVKYFTRKWISIALVLCMLLVVFPASAEQLVRESTSWRDKICPDTWDAMENATYDELIPVWIFRELIEEEVIEEQLYEAGFDPALYENPERLNAEIIEPMVAEVVATVGYDVAHFVENRTYNYQLALALEEDPLLAEFEFDFSESRRVSSSRDEVWQAAVELDVAYEEYRHAIGYDMSLVEWHIHQVMDEYMMTRRGILYDNYVADNQEFVEQYIGDYDDRILYSGYFTTTVIAELTAEEIKAIARIREVELIELHVDHEIKIEVDEVIAGKIGVSGSTGTRTNGWNGSGVRVGMIENALPDFTAPQLRGNSLSRIMVVDNIGVGWSTVASSRRTGAIDHATKVASILMGRRVAVGMSSFEGVVPSITRLYMSGIGDNLGNMNYLARAVQEMARLGVHVVNISAGAPALLGLAYTSYEREIDRTIFTSRMAVVTSAGNRGLHDAHITAPGNGLNVITVGNLNTHTLSRPPYMMASDSSYRNPRFLPNKPDIAAPGTNVRTVGRNGNVVNNLNDNSGTSFAAPLVAGVAAQLVQSNHVDGVTVRPAAIKATLALTADTGAIMSSFNNTITSHLRERSGAGLLDARGAVSAIQLRNPQTTLISDTLMGGETGEISRTFSITAGQNIHVALAVVQHPNNITVVEDTASVHIRLWCLRDDRMIANSSTNRQNIEIIRANNLRSGNYRLYITLHRGAAGGRSGTFSAIVRRF